MVRPALLLLGVLALAGVVFSANLREGGAQMDYKTVMDIPGAYRLIHTAARKLGIEYTSGGFPNEFGVGFETVISALQNGQAERNARKHHMDRCASCVQKQLLRWDSDGLLPSSSYEEYKEKKEKFETESTSPFIAVMPTMSRDEHAAKVEGNTRRSACESYYYACRSLSCEWAEDSDMCVARDGYSYQWLAEDTEKLKTAQKGLREFKWLAGLRKKGYSISRAMAVAVELEKAEANAQEVYAELNRRANDCDREVSELIAPFRRCEDCVSDTLFGGGNGHRALPNREELNRACGKCNGELGDSVVSCELSAEPEGSDGYFSYATCETLSGGESSSEAREAAEEKADEKQQECRRLRHEGDRRYKQLRVKACEEFNVSIPEYLARRE